MLYALSENNFIDTANIVRVRYEKVEGAVYPHILCVETKDNQMHRIGYKDKNQCQRDIQRLVNATNQERTNPVTRYEIETLLRSERENIKRYIKKKIQEVIDSART